MVVPPDNGSSQRMFHLFRELSRTHDVRQYSQPRLEQTRRPGFERELEVTPTYREYRDTNLLSMLTMEWCHRAWMSTPLLSGAVLRITRPARLRADLGWADLCIVEFPWQYAFCRSVRPQGPIVLVAHNVEAPTRAAAARSAGVDPDGSRLLRYVERAERDAVSTADLIVAVSEEDRRGLIESYGIAPDRVVVLPNGSDTDGIVPADSAARAQARRVLGLPERPTALYVAAIPKRPDRDGLTWIRRVARRMPDVTFLVLGGIVSRPFTEANVVATGLVGDPLPYFNAAGVSVCPIEHGGGTKIKVWDSLAAGLPLVAFPETLHGTGLVPGEHVLVAEKAEESLVSAIRRILDDGELAGRLAAQGRSFVVARHDWKALARSLDDALAELVRSRALPGAAR
jgi:glycosyltransferase involved in cell wall biosynthesis